MKLYLSRPEKTKKQHLVLTCDAKEAFLIHGILVKQVMGGKKRPQRNISQDGTTVKYRFKKEYLGRILFTLPYIERSPGIERLIEYDSQNGYVEADVPELEIPGFDGELWDFQKVGVGTIYDRLRKKGTSFMLNDEMGLGKTLQALCSAAMLDAFPLLVVCPNSGKSVWEWHVENFFPMLSCRVVEGGPVQRAEAFEEEADITIVNFESLWRHCKFKMKEGRIKTIRNPELRRKYEMIIIDEMHRIKNPQAKQTRGVVAMRAKRKLAMSGTPMLNGRPEELYPTLHYFWPDKFTSFYMFKKEHVVTEGAYGALSYNPQKMDKLKKFLQENSVRRRKEQVLKDLPTKLYVTKPVELTAEQRRLYNEIRDDMLVWLDDGSKKSLNSVLAQLTRLKQACFSPELYGGSPESAKLTELKEIVKELVASGEKAIIFSQWATATRIIRRELADYNPAYVDGSVPRKNRVTEQDKFNNDDDCKLYIGTIDSNKEAISLGAATYVIFTDKVWTPASHDQAEDRSASGGLRGLDATVEHVHIIEIQALDTIEQRIERLLERKRAVFNSVIEKDKGRKIKKITVQDIRQIL